MGPAESVGVDFGPPGHQPGKDVDVDMKIEVLAQQEKGLVSRALWNSQRPRFS